ncbi:MAG: protein kinase [Planctomycetes bacterium]|nr:protein kinase [Planctomycetota bacterium]
MHFNSGDSFAQGKYRLEEVIGDGSDAQVWLAYEHRVQRNVVIKILREPNVDVGARHRFEVEARALGAINHDGVIKLLEYSSEPDSPSYMVLDHGGAKTLLSCIKGECEVFNNMSLRERLEKFNVAVEGLAVAHTSDNHQIIHRDIKPNNILWDGNRFRLCDFGRCSIDGISGGDVSGQFIGNFVNPAPEQFFEKPIVTAETDVFNIVAAMHSMLTGEGIYQVEGLFGTKEAAVAGRIVWGASFKKIDKPLRAIIEAGLKYNRDERYPRAESLHSDIARYINNEKVSVSVETPYQKGRRWIKRYPWPAALLSSLVIVAGLTTYIAYQERVSSQQAQQVLHAFSGLLKNMDPLLPSESIVAQSQSLKELQEVLDTSTNLSAELQSDLYYSLGGRYMQLNAFRHADKAFESCLEFGENDLASINRAWCLREGAHLWEEPGEIHQRREMYELAKDIVFDIQARDYPTGDGMKDYIILLAKNRYASILLSGDDFEMSEALDMLLYLDGKLRNIDDSEYNIPLWLLPVNTGNLGSAYMAKSLTAGGEIEYLDARKALAYHQKSEKEFVAVGLEHHPEMVFAYRGQAECHLALFENEKGLDALRRAYRHRRDNGMGYTNAHLLEIINLHKALYEYGNGDEFVKDEILRLEEELCEYMHSTRLEVGIHESVRAFHDDKDTGHCKRK